MHRYIVTLLFILSCNLTLAASATKTHTIAFGKWTTVQWNIGQTSLDPNQSQKKLVPLKIRALLVDTRLREFTVGAPHDVTERIFVVQRAFRINDSLPQESNSPPHWQWQRGGWLLVDRVTGRVTPINLPGFDPLNSAASWYRDYAAYCGVSEDGKKIYAVVAQLSRRKPVLNKPIDGLTILESGGIDSGGARPSGTAGDQTRGLPDSLCPSPAWQRSPTRVAFEPAGVNKQTFAVRGHTIDLITDGDDEEEAEK